MLPSSCRGQITSLLTQLFALSPNRINAHLRCRLLFDSHALAPLCGLLDTTRCPGPLAPSVPRDNTIARRSASQGGEGVCLKPCQSVKRCTGGVPLSVARRGAFVGDLDGVRSCVTSHKMLTIAHIIRSMPHKRHIAPSDKHSA